MLMEYLKNKYGKNYCLGITDYVLNDKENTEMIESKINCLFDKGLDIDLAQGILSNIKLLNKNNYNIFEDVYCKTIYRVITLFPSILTLEDNTSLYVGTPKPNIMVTRGINPISLNTSLADYFINPNGQVKSEFIYGYLRFNGNDFDQITLNPYHNNNYKYNIENLINDTSSNNNLAIINKIGLDYTKLHLNLSNEEIEYLINMHNYIYRLIDELELKIYTSDFKAALALLSTIEQLLTDEGVSYNRNKNILKLIKS